MGLKVTMLHMCLENERKFLTEPETVFLFVLFLCVCCCCVCVFLGWGGGGGGVKD